MRRITVALALAGAVTATGCGASKSPSSGSGKGVAEGTFAIRIQNGVDDQGNALNPSLAIKGGKVYTDDGKLDCGEGVAAQKCVATYAIGATVAIKAQVIAPNLFLGWAGDCSGDGACAVVGNADRYVVASFGLERTGHPSWTDPALHGPRFRAYAQGDTTYDCKACHGAAYQGQGIAVTCTGCHGAALLTFVEQNPGTPVHGSTAYADLFGAVADGPSVTAVCVGCHTSQAKSFMETQHWTWKGPTPQLQAIEDFTVATPLARVNPGTIGKSNLVNNFCVSVASNDKRCDQCHAGYGTTETARSAANQVNPRRVDCLICHSAVVKADMTGVDATYGYSKIAGNFGAAGKSPSAAATNASLKDAATKIGAPTRANCGFCHFNAGGADSVKLMSTALAAPEAATDVHLSPSAGGLNLTCASCHADSNHRVKGAGVSLPVNTARTTCEECHGAAPHDPATLAVLNRHTDAVACQTCHIPGLSRAKAHKVDWDWSTMGNKGAGLGGTIYGCYDPATNVTTDLGAGNYGNACAAGLQKVKMYDYMKGHFRWEQNIRPAYAWYDGTMTHATTLDKGALVAGAQGLTASDRITLSAPLGSAADLSAKIFPFKVMYGRQPVYVDGDASFIITPKLFGNGPADASAFWGITGASFGWAYTPGAGEGGAVTVPAVTAKGTYTTTTAGAGAIEDLFSNVFTAGAKAAGQYPASAPTMARWSAAAPTAAGWDWRYTQMFMDLNHEVAPKANALGCGACHGASPVIDFTRLGYACANPSACPKRP